MRFGERHSISLVSRSGTFENWYVNFERDHVRTSVSLDIVDEKLDLIVLPDGTLQWKDEDEFAAAAGSGYLDGRGRAFGVLSTLYTDGSGANGVTDLARALAYANAHGGIGHVVLVPGREPFRLRD